MSALTTRRRFLEGSGPAGAVGLLLVKPGSARGSQAASAVSLGLIGCGNRGMYVSGIFAKHEYVKVTAICDVYEDRRKAALEKYSGARPFTDHRELLKSDIDMVLIASPAFLHPEHFEAAVEARKHIFMEKPAAVNADGCQRVLRAAKKADAGKRISVDFQQRYGKDYRKAYEIMKSGELGAIKMVRAAWLGGGPPIQKGHPPAEEKIRNWFFYRELSGDILVEQDCHNIDVVNWFADRHPVRVSGYGSQMIRKYGDVFDNLSATFQFEDGLIFSYAANQFRTPTFSDISETFLCEKGALTTSRGGYTIRREGKPPETVATKYDITEDAVGEFVDGVLKGQLENAAFSAAESTLTAVMALEALVRRREMTWEQISRG